MPRIQPLAPEVVNQIAAGEVIERPASVAKELLENSLDALATRIEVDVAAGGTELIRIADDGEGVPEEDLPLALTQHATSKLRTPADLFTVATMGFRGEALASIASVSRFKFRSRPEGQELAAEIAAEGGSITPVTPRGGPLGTTVEVRDLFFNVPARRKFLKTNATEFGHLAEQFTRVALANPRLHATLRHNGKVVYDLPPAVDLRDRLATFFGSKIAERLIPVSSESDIARLWGFAGHPGDSKGSRKGNYLFLNGRWITDRSLQHALSEAYRGLVMIGRHPISFLFLETAPDAADVNVHPTKCEVRFRDSSSLYRQLLGTLRTEFLKRDFEQRFHLPGDPAKAKEQPASLPEKQAELADGFADWARAALMKAESEPVPEVESPPLPDLPVASTESPPHNAEAPQSLRVTEPNQKPKPQDVTITRAMQVLDTYLVLETDAGLQVIDQHALHERVMYETLRRRVLGEGVEIQRLLVPESVELDAKRHAAVLEHADTLGELGFEVEDFGGTTVLLNGFPVLLKRADPTAVLSDAADALADSPKTPDRRDLLDSLLHMMSCKAAVKAGQRLSPEEIDALLTARHLVDDAHHCPHGRPTALTLSRDDLDRQFGRMG
ncbi:DNA mismatch repair endonuclease MutL [Alienimonas chondri]|uniref:DNA mismatch repair protein MutL n=1 Tax=Alienimonas chondri TaxID=2681879 RepID=A0ABX1V8R6_9PLAN|nr:DNA mismatch repair endonuclease MutL [Alienimonas chondri]NNJ24507.1 DNA mismatch repair protein MutL [Alienimonas chondri]